MSEPFFEAEKKIHRFADRSNVRSVNFCYSATQWKATLPETTGKPRKRHNTVQVFIFLNKVLLFKLNNEFWTTYTF